MTNEQALALAVFLVVHAAIAVVIVKYIVMPLRQRMIENGRRQELEVAVFKHNRDMRILRDILDEEGGR